MNKNTITLHTANKIRKFSFKNTNLQIQKIKIWYKKLENRENNFSFLIWQIKSWINHTKNKSFPFSGSTEIRKILLLFSNLSEKFLSY